ncbi:recombinase family protein [Flavobacterium sp. GSB-24]|uniref:recombinase family protein n=1 Tax=Flavobacterium sp. GSB-24 TaxID=2994319 RepID=UPI0024930EFC|nr:recombinase family protein [Flavobacterium sp. GSB-24]BDU27654.1 resolvase [Flavobacterium sp. GSB-24]
MKIGYARVSTQDQNITSQIQLLEGAGCERIFQDHASGVNDKRPGLLEMLSILRKDDIVIIYKTDRLFRSLRNMIELIEKFNLLGVKFKSLSEPEFDTTSANGKLFLQIFSAFAEFERSLISERTKVGLDSARRRNQTLGRPKGIKPGTKIKYETALHFYKNKGIPIEAACENAGISKTTFYRVDSFIKAKEADKSDTNQTDIHNQIKEISSKNK